MDSDAESDLQKATGEHKITPAERIKELMVIDQDVAKMLHAASQAIRALTVAPSSTTKEGSAPPLDASKRAFEDHTTDFYTLAQSISAHLRRQTYALEEANIIAADQSSEVQIAPLSKPAQFGGRSGLGAAAQGRSEPPMQITNGGLGNLDVGWLNSRRDAVGKQKEAELWHQARILLEELDHEQKSGEDDMEVDSPGG